MSGKQERHLPGVSEGISLPFAAPGTHISTCMCFHIFLVRYVHTQYPCMYTCPCTFSSIVVLQNEIDVDTNTHIHSVAFLSC